MTLEMKYQEMRELGRTEGKAEGRAEGRVEGRAEGLEVMLSLINGQITVEEAAKCLDISVDELKTRMKMQ